MVYRTINFNISGQVKDHSDGEVTAETIEAELKLIAARYGLDIEGCIGF